MQRLRPSVPIMVAWLIASRTTGQCALRPYAFRGVIRSQCNGPVVADARIFVFLDDQDGTLSAGGNTRYPDFFRSDRHGKFRANAWFDTFVSYDPQAGHRCDRVPTRVEVVVTRTKYLSKRVTLDLAKLSAVREGDVQVFDLPAIELEPSEGKS